MGLNPIRTLPIDGQCVTKWAETRQTSRLTISPVSLFLPVWRVSSSTSCSLFESSLCRNSEVQRLAWKWILQLLRSFENPGNYPCPIPLAAAVDGPLMTTSGHFPTSTYRSIIKQQERFKHSSREEGTPCLLLRRMHMRRPRGVTLGNSKQLNPQSLPAESNLFPSLTYSSPPTHCI